MISDLALSLFRLLWYCFGIFLVLSISFNVLTGKRTDISATIKPLLRVLHNTIKTVSDCCGAAAELIARRIAPRHAAAVAAVIQIAMLVSLVSGVLALAAGHVPKDALCTNTGDDCCYGHR